MRKHLTITVISGVFLVIFLSLFDFSTAYAKISLVNPQQKEWQCSTYKGRWKCSEVHDQLNQLFKPFVRKDEKSAIVAKALGWIPSVNPDNICGGYYYAPRNYAQAQVPGKVYLNYNSVEYLPEGLIIANNGVEISKNDQNISAKHAKVYTDPKTKRIQKILAKGNVNFSQAGQLVVGKNFQTNPEQNVSTLNDAYYLMQVSLLQGSMSASAPLISGHDAYLTFTGYAHGHADKVVQDNKQQFTLYSATYATGSPLQNHWQLDASKILIDKVTGSAYTYNDLLRVQGVPIFYIPYFSFPIDSRRKTGLLYPMVGTGSEAGMYYTQPIYLNLAPNYDLLVTPTYYTKAGILIDSKGRYLTTHHSGQVEYEVAPYNPHTKKSNQNAIFLHDSGSYGNGFTSQIQYGNVSNPDFLNTYATNVYDTNSQINNSASLAYTSAHWLDNITFTSYQFLKPTNDGEILSPVNQPYQTLPQINLNGNYTFFKHLNFSTLNQYTYFYKSNVHIDPAAPLVTGERMYNEMDFPLVFESSWGSLTPEFILVNRAYDLQHNVQSKIQNSIPEYSLDVQLHFIRDFKVSENAYQQTLTPHLKYIYIPYVSQGNIPLFDTAYSNFSFGSLFLNNQFTGYDRINNTNQISYALETSVMNAMGANIFSAGIGEAAYFVDRKVQLATLPTYNSSHAFSDIVGYSTFNIFNDWQVSGNIAYNPYSKIIDLQTYALQYHFSPQYVINASYNFIRFDQSALTPEQIQNPSMIPAATSDLALSGLWRLTPHWTVAAQWAYSFVYSAVTSELLALSYNDSDWSISAMVLQERIANDPNNPLNYNSPMKPTFMLQFVLKGLGENANEVTTQLMTQIPGFIPIQSGFI